MQNSDIILIVVFSLILFGLIGFLIFILLKDKKDVKREEKFSSIKESSMLNDMDSKKISNEARIETVTKTEVVENIEATGTQVESANTPNISNAAEMKKPLTKEERERLINPFGVDMTRRTSGKESNPDNKFFK